MSARLLAILDGFRAALRRERLPAPPPQVTQRTGPPGLLQLILAREPLPLDPESVAVPRRGLLPLIFAIEPLDKGPPLPVRRRAHWLGWLLRPEKLDD
jgi:hypothetical protein